MGARVYFVDAFSTRVGAGNPAAVVVLGASPFPDAALCQRVAFELGFAETAFVRETGQRNRYELKWYTPEQEVDLCGHATLAAAAVLLCFDKSSASNGAAAVLFDTLSGQLPVAVDGGTFVLDFPARPPVQQEAPDALWAGLRIEKSSATFVGKARDFLVVVKTPAEVLAVRPDFAVLATVDALCVIVSARADEGDSVDIVSRVFCPGCGVPEDPVTGSAHCTIAPFWGGVLKRDRLVCRQASQRGGVVICDLTGERVALRGTAVLVLEGRLADGTGIVGD